MSQEEQALIIGKVLMEHKEKAELLEKLKAKAYEIGINLSTMGKMLQENPEKLNLEGHGVDPQFQSRCTSFSPKFLDSSNIIALCDQIRTVDSEVSSLEQRKKGLGY